MKKVTGIAVLTTGEGDRITYTYSEISDNGTIISSNQKKSFVVLDDETTKIVAALRAKVQEHLLTD